MPDHYAVMGNPVAHSLSPTIHRMFAQQTDHSLIYDKIQIEESQFERQVVDFFNAGGSGLNITLPCKQRAFAMSDDISPRCLLAKAANTLWMHAGKLCADNTDGIGLLRDLSRHVELSGKTILLLGAGGAARGIVAPLLAANPAQLTIANRTIENADILQKEFLQTSSCSLAEVQGPYDIVINATAASLNNHLIELSATILTSQPFCYDLAYQPKAATPFVTWAQEHGCVAMDGLGMLVEQAAEAFFIWHGVMPAAAPVLHYLRSAL